jgi:hypothetical protein
MMTVLESTEIAKERMQNSRAMRLSEFFRGVGSLVDKNDEPLLEGMLTQVNSGTSWLDMRQLQIEWSGDALSEIIFQGRMFSDEWFNEERYRYTYNAGLLELYYEDIWQDGWENEYSEQYSYITIDGQAFVDEVISETSDGTYRIDISYEGSTIVSADEYEDINGEWELIGEISFMYDGSDLTETYTSYESGEAEPEYRNIYEDTSPEEYYAFIQNQQDYIPTQSPTLIFVQLDRPATIEQFWDGDGWQNEYRTERTTETNPEEGVAELLTITFSEYEGEWISYDRFEIGYGDLDEVLFGRSMSYDSLGDEWFEESREIFEYDENDLPVTILLGEYDSFGDTFIAYQRTILTWDDTAVNIEGDTGYLPNAFTLGNAYPNPFNPTTNVPFELNRSGHVTLQAFDMLGRQVATLVNEPLAAGTHTVAFDAGNLPAASTCCACSPEIRYKPAVLR